MLLQIQAYFASLISVLRNSIQCGPHWFIGKVGLRNLRPRHYQAPPHESYAVTTLYENFPFDPYVDLAVVGIGMTGIVFKIDDYRVVKKAKVYALENLTEPERLNAQYMNEINTSTLLHETQVYKRLGYNKGIVSCTCISPYGIELEFSKQGDLQSYIECRTEPPRSVKVEWILSLIRTLSYVHSRKVFLDEIALRNILVFQDQLKFVDFGQSILLPLTADMNTIRENDLTARIEILHLGWIIYSIAVWKAHHYYFFSPEHSGWPKPDVLPKTDNLFCGHVIEKCLSGDYAGADALEKDARSVLGGLGS
ncbi:kinase-like domain-containing protein [Penicillium chermesinum]|uniref:Kinase-like domain-containing protein n=1 Tax=Penicillium chermesinum TaxID=63820 RepID=A0A9W9U0Q2_9EURO|nr:kinase-like domain-containing protein [Penicillium chermesinum]KAJ5249291.1 kinase-like domain-containing protein [Penicillium chermesinum]